MQPAIAVISQYIHAFEKRGFRVAEAGKQWKKLEELLLAEGITSAALSESLEPLSIIDAGGPPRIGNPNMKHKSTIHGVYEPNDKVKSMPHVFQKKKRVVLHCKKCSSSLISAWVAIVKGQERVMRPSNGHVICGSPYISLEGKNCVDDHVNCLDICEHETLRSICRICNPSVFCHHGKRRRACKLCRAAGLVRTRDKKYDEGAPAKKQRRVDSQT